MKKCFLRLICSILTVLILTITPGLTLASDNHPGVNPLGDYTALGDSITAGYGDMAEGGYVGRIYKFLSGDVHSFNIDLNNFGKNGSTSGDLLKSLREDMEMRQALEKSRFVTICTGGNNLLGPVIAAVSKTFNVNPDNNPNLVENIQNALKNDPGLLPKLLQLLSPDALPAEMQKGAVQFQNDWPKIIGLVSELAPNATIYVSTVYNPMKPGDPFFTIFDRALSGINTTIKGSNAVYTVVDIHSLFVNYKGDKPLTGFNLFAGSVDPHPTPEGYELIYQAYLPNLINTLQEGPGDLISRADAVMYLLRITGLTVPFAKNFSDLQPDAYYYGAAGIAKKLGITAGIAGNEFHADAAVTRQDLLIFTGRLLQKLKLPYESVSAAYLGKYSDSGALAPYARRYASTVLGNGLIKFDAGKLEPGRSVTREEFFELLKALLIKCGTAYNQK